jgi:hypothetical protein
MDENSYVLKISREYIDEEGIINNRRFGFAAFALPKSIVFYVFACYY